MMPWGVCVAWLLAMLIAVWRCRSLYICKGIVAVTKASAFEHHCCSTPDCPIVFDDLPDNSVATREARFDERCTKCGARRFERVGGQIQAVQRCVVAERDGCTTR